MTICVVVCGFRSQPYVRIVVWAGVGEWLNPADCKSVAYGFAGSNPAPCTSAVNRTEVREASSGPHSSVVERVLGKNEVPSSILGVGSISPEKSAIEDEVSSSLLGGREENVEASI